MSLAINPKIDGTLELKNNDTAKTLMTFDSQGRQTNPNGLSYVGGSTLVDGLSAVFTNSTNNINATGIGVGVEVGDVIQISGSVNNNGEFTVEVITDADNVIVNQAHAGKSRTVDPIGAKALIDETATVTIKLLCKWYLAPSGLGQGWVNVTANRAIGSSYANQTKRQIRCAIKGVSNAAGGYVGIIRSGESFFNQVTGSIAGTRVIELNVDADVIYSYLIDASTSIKIFETR